MVSLPPAAGAARWIYPPGMTDAVAPKAGMTISVRTRRDVVVMDPDRFLAAARQALRDRNPELTDAEAAEAVADVYNAVHALLDRDGALAADAVDGEAVGIDGPLPGRRVSDRRQAATGGTRRSAAAAGLWLLPSRGALCGARGG